MSSWETDASIELSVIPPQTQTESARIYKHRATQHTICLLGFAWEKLLSMALNLKPCKHSSRHMLLFSPSERLMGLIHIFNHVEM